MSWCCFKTDVAMQTFQKALKGSVSRRNYNLFLCGGTTFVCGTEAPASSPCRVLFEVARVERDGDPAPMFTCSYKCSFMWYLWCGVFVCLCRPAKTGNLHAPMILPNSFVYVPHCLFLKCLSSCFFLKTF